jgi:hypothetical protein
MTFFFDTNKLSQFKRLISSRVEAFFNFFKYKQEKSSLNCLDGVIIRARYWEKYFSDHFSSSKYNVSISEAMLDAVSYESQLTVIYKKNLIRYNIFVSLTSESIVLYKESIYPEIIFLASRGWGNFPNIGADTFLQKLTILLKEGKQILNN